MIEIPQTVKVALGPEAARDFASWIESLLQASAAQAQMPISAAVARQKVNVLMLGRVGNLLMAGEPVLTRAGSGGWVWRTPVDLTLPSRGRVGRVGELDVDAALGQVYYTDDILAEFEKKADFLAENHLSDQ